MNPVQRFGLWLAGGEFKKASAPVPHVSTYASGHPIINYEWSAERATREGLHKSGWLYVAVTKKARALASVPLIVERQTRKGWTPEPRHPIQALLSAPNPHMDMQGMMERWAQHMELAGNALWHKVISSSGEVLELWPILPDQISPIPSRQDYLAGYQFRPTPQDRIVLPTEQVIHWQYQDPANSYWGLPPVKAAAQAVDGDLDALTWNRQTVRNGARPAGVVSLSAEMTEEQWLAAEQMIRNQTSGAMNARQFLAFGGATKVDSFGFNATEMDFLGGRRLNREEIFAVIGVPAILATQGESATYANMETAGRFFWNDTLIPLLDDFCRTLTGGLFPGQSGYRIRADLSNVPALRENEQQRAGTALTLTQAGYAAESVAQHLGLPLQTVQQAADAALGQQAQDTLKGLSPEARGWIGAQIGREVRSLSPPEALKVARAMGSPQPQHALKALEWEGD